MAKQLVLISHGRFCEELKKSTEMIMGPQESIYAVPLLPEEGGSDFRAKLESVLSGLDDVVILADLLGGTPANVASTLLLEGATFDLYTGMNMAMVIGFLNGVLLDQDVDLLVYGNDGIKHVNTLLADTDDDDED